MSRMETLSGPAYAAAMEAAARAAVARDTARLWPLARPYRVASESPDSSRV